MSDTVNRKAAIAEARKLQRMFQSFQSVVDGLGELEGFEDELNRLKTEIARHTKDRDDATAMSKQAIAEAAAADDKLAAARKEAADIIVLARQEAASMKEEANQFVADRQAQHEKRSAGTAASFKERKAELIAEIEQLEAARDAAQKDKDKATKALLRIRNSINEGAS